MKRLTEEGASMAQHRPSSTSTSYAPSVSTGAPRTLTQRLAVTLLTQLPRRLDEATERVAPAHLDMIRKALTMMIEEGSLSAWEGDRLSPLFKVIGVGAQAQRLRELARPSEPEGQRAQALAALFHSGEGQRLFHQLSDEERVALCAPWVRPMMSMASEDHFPSYALAALFESTAHRCQPELLRRFERCRAEVAGCPKGAYEVLLRQEGLACDDLELLFSLIGERGQLEALKGLRSEWPHRTRAAFVRVEARLKRAQAS